MENPFPFHWDAASASHWWNHIGRYAHSYFGWTAYHRYILRCIQKCTALHGAILDYGCGEGGLLKQMANLNAQLYAATLSENQLQATQQHLANQPNFVQVLRITPEFFHQYAAHFDQIIVCYVLMYIPPSERATLFEQLHRLLKPNGQLIIVNEPVAEEPKPNMLCPHCSAAFATIGPATITTHETVHPFAQSAGFTLVKKRTFRTYAPCDNRWQQMLSIVWNALAPKPFTDLLWVYQT